MEIQLARRNAMARWVADRIDFRFGNIFKTLSGVSAHAHIPAMPSPDVWDWNRWYDVDDICTRQRGRLTGILKMCKIARHPCIVIHHAHDSKYKSV